MRLAVVVMVVLSILGPAHASDVVKALGDINGDKVVERASIRVVSGASSDASDVAIYSGKHKVLILPRLSGNVLTGQGGDTADGFAVLSDGRIACWKGDWLNTPSKWEPHHYDFWWYRWDPRSKKYVQSREGFTAKPFSIEKARQSLKKMAAKPDGVVLSRGRSFGGDAVGLGSAYFKRRYKSAVMLQVPGSSDEARAYVLDQTGAYVTFLRDGKVRFGKMEG